MLRIKEDLELGEKKIQGSLKKEVLKDLEDFKHEYIDYIDSEYEVGHQLK